MIVVRKATLADLSSIMDFSRSACERSPTYSITGFNSVIWRRQLKASLADPDMVVLVAIRDKKVCGLLVGMRAPAPWFAGYSATDIVFTAEAGGEVLLDAFVAWCIAKKVTRMDMGVSDEVSEEKLAAYDRMFRIAGFRPAGRVYYRIMEGL